MKFFLLIDIGNTLIKIAIANNSEIICQLPIIKTKNKNAIYQLIKLLKKNQKIVFEKIIISCVVSKFLIIIKNIIFFIYNLKPLIVNLKLLNFLPLKTKLEQKELGSDLIALSYAAYNKYSDAIVISLGTAITYSVIVNNFLIGVIISPGLNVSKNSLINNVSLFGDFDINYYNSILGKNNNHALSIGFGYGFGLMIKNMINKIKLEVNIDLTVILTGGDFWILKSYFNFIYIHEPYFLFLGLINILKYFNNNKIKNNKAK